MEIEKGYENKKIVIQDHTDWTKTEIAVLVYFSGNKNKPSTYREIARGYVSSSYSNYQKACEHLVKKGFLVKTTNGRFSVGEGSWEMVKSGTETVIRALPYFNSYRRRLKR